MPATERTALLDEPAPPWPAERRIGGDDVVRELGRGGMGIVYVAERADADFHQLVALKCLLPGVATDALTARFRRERRILATLNHPAIAQLHDGGVSSTGAPYLVMEYVDGEPLDQYCDRHQLDVEARLQLFSRVCEAVQYAHQHVKRDWQTARAWLAHVLGPA